MAIKNITENCTLPNRFFKDILSLNLYINCPFDLLQEVGLIFCMTDLEVIDMLRLLSEKYSASVAYSDVAGIRQLQITQQIDPKVLIEQYYE